MFLKSNPHPSQKNYLHCIHCNPLYVCAPLSRCRYERYKCEKTLWRWTRHHRYARRNFSLWWSSRLLDAQATPSVQRSRNCAHQGSCQAKHMWDRGRCGSCLWRWRIEIWPSSKVCFMLWLGGFCIQQQEILFLTSPMRNAPVTFKETLPKGRYTGDIVGLFMHACNQLALFKWDSTIWRLANVFLIYINWTSDWVEVVLIYIVDTTDIQDVWWYNEESGWW